MERVKQLRAFLERIQRHKKYCEQRLSEFARSGDVSDPKQELYRSDLLRTESMASRLRRQLDEIMDQS
jgi:hypothetical protein